MNGQRSTSLHDIIPRAAQQLPHGHRTALRKFLTTDVIQRFTTRLVALHDVKGQESLPGPHFVDETTDTSPQAYTLFLEALNRWQLADGNEPAKNDIDETVTAFAAALKSATPSILLRVLGQRTTAGSITDYRAFPPLESILLEAAMTTVAKDGTLSVAARALAKHSARSTDEFWGDATGGDEYKNAAAGETVSRMLSAFTWWNVFQHAQHGLLYEIRLDSGHGARWTVDGDRFVGFVDPFDESMRREQQPEETQEAADDDDGVATSAGERLADEETPDSARDSATDAGNSLAPANASEPGRLTRAVLQERLDAGITSFRGCELSGEDLTGMDLDGTDFVGCDFRRCKLFGTSFRDADLTECDFTGNYLAGTEFSGAVLRRASLRKCRADNVVWRNVDLEGARLDQMNLRDARIEGGRMRRVGLARADLTGAILDHCRLYGAFMEGSTLTGAYLNACRLRNARMASVECVEARLDHSTLDGADLSNANLTRAQFHHCSFAETILEGTDLSGSILNNGVLDRARLAGARLTDSQLVDASLVRADLSRASLRNANLSRARIEQADLSRADLRSAIFDGANLQGADLTGTNVVETSVDEHTRFEAARTIGVDFGTNWLLRQRVADSAHNLTIRHFRKKHPIIGFLWWALLGCGKRPGMLLGWGVFLVLLFAVIMSARPGSFDFGQPDPDFIDHLRNSLAVFVTLDLAVDKGVDGFGRTVMLAEMLLSYLMLGFMASLFSGIFPNAPE